MIHVVTAANRRLYRDQIEDMHRQRWLFFIEHRGWSELKALQDQAGVERDQYDDGRAVYLLALSETGAVEGAMRLRPTDDKSLIGDRFPDLISPELGPGAGARLGGDTWEITRVMRAPAFRGQEGELRLRLSCASCEFALTRAIKTYVAVMDTFLLPSIRALNRGKHRVLGLPQDYAEGEMIAIALAPDAEWLAMCRKLAGFEHPLMFELPPPVSAPALTPMQELALAKAMRGMRPDIAVPSPTIAVSGVSGHA
jgi:acyl-homoserine lactone synthase